MEHDTNDNIESDTEIAEITYITSEVAKMLGMASTTIRKYSQSLQEKGYSFLKGQGTGHRQARLFTEKDVTVLRYLKEIREETNITVELATSIVIERFGEGTTQSALLKKTHEKAGFTRYDRQHDELKEMINEQKKLLINQSELVLNVTERIEKQEKYLSQPTENKQIEAFKKEDVQEPILKNKTKKGLLARIFNINE